MKERTKHRLFFSIVLSLMFWVTTILMVYFNPEQTLREVFTPGMTILALIVFLPGMPLLFTWHASIKEQ